MDIHHEVLVTPRYYSRLPHGVMLGLGAITRTAMPDFIAVTAEVTLDGTTLDGENMTFGVMREYSGEAKGDWLTASMPLKGGAATAETELCGFDAKVAQVEADIFGKNAIIARRIVNGTGVTYDVQRNQPGKELLEKLIGDNAPARLQRSGSALLGLSNALFYYLNEGTGK
jgi:hypothetical protein